MSTCNLRNMGYEELISKGNFLQLWLCKGVNILGIFVYLSICCIKSLIFFKPQINITDKDLSLNKKRVFQSNGFDLFTDKSAKHFG